MKSLLCLLALLFAVNFSYAQNTFPTAPGTSVGIGTTTPTALLNISQNTGEIGDYTLQRWDYGAVPTFNLQLKQHISSGLATWGFDLTNGGISYPNTLVLNNGNVGIGTTSPGAKLSFGNYYDVGGTNPTSTVRLYELGNIVYGFGVQTGALVINANQTGAGNILFNAGADNNTPSEKMRIMGNGNVGIGTQNPDQKLTVNGTIHAKEVKVDLSVPAPDYVFEKSYKLKSLQEVAKYVALNKHLSEIPSAKVMEQNGVNVSEMNMKLLQKVEELTLYLIEKDKKDKEQQSQIDELKQQVETLIKKIRKTEKLAIKTDPF